MGEKPPQKAWWESFCPYASIVSFVLRIGIDDKEYKIYDI